MTSREKKRIPNEGKLDCPLSLIYSRTREEERIEKLSETKRVFKGTGAKPHVLRG